MKVKTRAAHFKSLTFRDKGISRECATHIYKAICRPVIEYGSLLFVNCPSRTMYHLEVAERSALRSITRIRHPNNPLHNPSNHVLYNLTNIIPIHTRIKTLATKISKKFPEDLLTLMTPSTSTNNIRRPTVRDTICSLRCP